MRKRRRTVRLSSWSIRSQSKKKKTKNGNLFYENSFFSIVDVKRFPSELIYKSLSVHSTRWISRTKPFALFCFVKVGEIASTPLFSVMQRNCFYLFKGRNSHTSSTRRRNFCLQPNDRKKKRRARCASWKSLLLNVGKKEKNWLKSVD